MNSYAVPQMLRNDVMERILEFVSQPILRYSDISGPRNEAAEFKRKQKLNQAAKRYPCRAKVMLTRGNRYLKGSLSNISMSGAFLETDLKIFEANEKVTLMVRPHGATRGYQLVAEIVRFTANGRQPQGYGLKFCRPHERV
jgi:hypothetical protein